MSYIPNCRPKYEKDAMPTPHKTKDEVKEGAINPYWYGLLTGSDKAFLQGFDWCITQAVNNLFDNLDVYVSELDEVGVNIDEVDTDIVNGASLETNITMNTLLSYDTERPYKDYSDYSEKELEKMTDATRLLLQIKTIINHYVEMERDELVTSMIEKMSEEEHEEAIERAKSKKKFRIFLGGNFKGEDGTLYDIDIPSPYFRYSQNEAENDDSFGYVFTLIDCTPKIVVYDNSTHSSRSFKNILNNAVKTYAFEEFINEGGKVRTYDNDGEIIDTSKTFTDIFPNMKLGEYHRIYEMDSFIVEADNEGL